MAVEPTGQESSGTAASRPEDDRHVPSPEAVAAADDSRCSECGGNVVFGADDGCLGHCESCGLEVHAPVLLGAKLIPYWRWRKLRKAVIAEELERLKQESAALDEFEAPRLRCVVAGCPAPSLIHSTLCRVHRDDYGGFLNRERVRRCRQRKKQTRS